MEILSFKKIEHKVPKGGSGTGHSEPDKFEVTIKDGDEVFKQNVNIDIWCCRYPSFKRSFLRDIRWEFKNEIENIDEAFEMWAKEALVGLNSYELYKDGFKEMYGFSV